MNKIKIIKCLTPNQRKGKIFQITEKGRIIMNKINEMKDGTI